MSMLIQAHGGSLCVLYMNAALDVERARSTARELQFWDMNLRQMCDLELMLSGAFSPLSGFMGRSDYESVVSKMRLTNGILWPIPITLDVSRSFAEKISVGDTVALRDAEGVTLALIDVSEIWEPDKHREALHVYGVDDESHPGVANLYRSAGEIYLGGRVVGLESPAHYDFRQHRHTPTELRAIFTKLGWTRTLACKTDLPIHRAEVEVTFQAAMRVEANLLIHAGVGMTKPDDIKYYARIRCYEHALKYYPEHTTMLSLLPLTTRMAGPREALLSAIVHKNYGCTHMIVGDTYADPWNTCCKRFYDTREAAKTMGAHEEELGIVAVPVEDVVYVSESMRFQRVSEVAAGETVFDISNNDLMQRLEKGEDLPSWFTFPEVLSELKRSSPPRHKQGYTVFLTGLSGSGKSTIANALLVKLLELGDRPVTLLDGDLVRKHLSSELGFSKHHRDLNVLRIGYVASEISKNGGVAICAPIAPYQQTREQVRHLIQSVGGFVEVHVSTPITVCEKRDRKGLYAKARAGLVKEFTGIDDPYQTPENPELRIDTSDGSPEEAAQQILLKLEHLGFLGRGRTRAES